MKVIHVIPSIDPAQGGPPQMAVRMATAQAALGHDVHLVYYRDASADIGIRKMIARLPRTGTVTHHAIVTGGLRETLFASVAKRVLSELMSGADWVHIHGIWGGIRLAAANVAHAFGVPYCFRPAGMLDPWSLQQKKWKKRFALTLAYRKALDRAAFIHALNDDEAHLLEPLGLRPPVEVLPNGIFEQELEPRQARGAAHAAFPQLQGRPYLLFLSRLHHKKGLDFLAEAFALTARRHADLQLVVAGPDEDGSGAAFARQIHQAGLSDRVHMLGPVYGHNKFALLTDAELFCLPSRQEGFSVAVIEALACGTPVVISPECHFPEVERAQAGEIAELHPVAIAAAIDRILCPPATRDTMGRNAARLVRHHFTCPKLALDCLNLYRKAIDLAHPATRTQPASTPTPLLSTAH